MKKILFYGMTGEKSCFMHVLLNAVQLKEAGHQVQVIFEGASVKLAPLFAKEENPVFLKARELGLIAGVCLACAKTLGVYEQAQQAGFAFLSDMSGHAGMKPYFDQGYEVISI